MTQTPNTKTMLTPPPDSIFLATISVFEFALRNNTGDDETSLKGLIEQEIGACITGISLISLTEAKLPKALPGVPYQIRITTRDGEHEYGDDAWFLARPGQDAYELADTIACFELRRYTSGDGSYVDSYSECWQRRYTSGDGSYVDSYSECCPWKAAGDHRLTEVGMPHKIEPEAFPDSYDLTPSWKVRWARMARKGVANYDASAIIGSVTFVNVLVKQSGKRSFRRVYVSTLVPEDEQGTQAQWYAMHGQESADSAQLHHCDYWQLHKIMQAQKAAKAAAATARAEAEAAADAALLAELGIED